MKLYMTNGEIVNSYKHCKDKKEQIKILSELNATDQRLIIIVLLANGLDVPDGIKSRYKINNSEIDKYKEKHKDSIEMLKVKTSNTVYGNNSRNWVPKDTVIKNITSRIGGDTQMSRKDNLVNKEEIKKMYIDEKLSFKQISEKTGVSPSTVGNIIKASGIKARNMKMDNITKEKLVELYINKNMTMQDTADQLGAAVSTIGNYLKKYNIKKKDNTNNKASVSIKKKDNTNNESSANKKSALTRIDARIEQLNNEIARLKDLRNKYIDVVKAIDEL